MMYARVLHQELDRLCCLRVRRICSQCCSCSGLHLPACQFLPACFQSRPYCDLEGGRACIHNYRSELTRHLLLLLRLQRPYLVYCVICFLLSLAAFCSTLVGLLSSSPKVAGARGPKELHAILEGGRWQTLCWTIVGCALIVEVLVTCLLHGVGQFLKDPWSFFDVAIIGLTAIAWGFVQWRHSSLSVVTPREVVELEVADVSLLGLRFVLQLSRVLATFFLTRKVRTMQNNSKQCDIPAVPMML